MSDAIDPYDISQISPFRDFFEPIGAMCMAFSILETHLTITIGQIMRLTPKEAYSIEAQIKNFTTRVQLFHTVASLNATEPKVVDGIKPLVDELKSLNTLRNRLIHGQWNNLDTETSVATKLRFGAQSGFRVESHNHSVDDINQATRSMLTLITHMALWLGLFENQDKQPTSH